MLFVLAVLPLILGLTVVLMSIMRKLRSQPAVETIKWSAALEEVAVESDLSRPGRGTVTTKAESQEEVFK